MIFCLLYENNGVLFYQAILREGMNEEKWMNVDEQTTGKFRPEWRIYVGYVV